MRHSALLVSALVLGACAPGVNFAADSIQEAGFWTGVWHGLGALLFLLYSLIGDSGIYEIYNTGFPYNAGFVLGFVSFVGIVGILIGREATNADDAAASFAIVPVLAGAAILLVGAVQLGIAGFVLVWAMLRS